MNEQKYETSRIIASSVNNEKIQFVHCIANLLLLSTAYCHKRIFASSKFEGHAIKSASLERLINTLAK